MRSKRITRRRMKNLSTRDWLELAKLKFGSSTRRIRVEAVRGDISNFWKRMISVPQYVVCCKNMKSCSKLVVFILPEIAE